MKFDSYFISDDIKKNLARAGFKRPTDIQYKAIPSILKGEDVLAIAQTGTGKTAAFAIPVIDKIHRYKSSKRAYGIKCIVMAPTRELAEQIGGVFSQLAKHTKVKSFALFGGVEQDMQVAKLQDGIDILITTPGRMFDLINQGELRLSSVTNLVLDEADHMLDLGFIEDIKYVKKMLKQRHQTLFFSATINDEIRKLAYSQVKSAAIRIQVSPEDKVSRNVSHCVMFVEMDDKRHFLQRFIKDHPDDKLIIFVRTRVRAERVAKVLNRIDREALTIHGDKDQTERADVMTRFRNGEVPVLIATDVCARGIDVAGVAYVLNYDLPDKPENYVHRVGRTGRGVSKGTALSFCSPEEKDKLNDIQGFLNADIERLKVNTLDYAAVAEKPAGMDGLRNVIAQQNTWENNHRPKKRSRKKSKKKK